MCDLLGCYSAFDPAVLSNYFGGIGEMSVRHERSLQKDDERQMECAAKGVRESSNDA